MYYKSILPIPTHLQKKMMLYVNMLCTRVINRVLSESNAALIISKGNCYRYLRKSISSSNVLNQTASFVAFECHVLHFHSWCCHFDRCGHCATNLSLLEYTTSSLGDASVTSPLVINHKSKAMHVNLCFLCNILGCQFPKHINQSSQESPGTSYVSTFDRNLCTNCQNQNTIAKYTASVQGSRYTIGIPPRNCT